jgi:ribosomal protein S27E
MSGTIYSITCPNCNKTVYVKKAVQQARMQCNHCGARFVGSTEGTAQVPHTPSGQAPRPSSPQASHPHASRRRHLGKNHGMHIRRKTPWTGIIICCVCVLGVIGAAVVMFNKADAVEQDIATAEADTKKKALPQKTVTVVAPAPVLGEEAAPAYAAELTGPKPGEPISVTTNNCVPIPGEAEESLILVGDYKNVSSRVLATVEITVLIKDNSGRTATLQSRAYKLVPPGVTGTFTAQAPSGWSAASEMEIVRITPRYAPASAMLTGWSLKNPAITVGTEGKRRIFAKGDIKNETKSYLKDPQVVADFFTDEEIYIGSAMGTFHGEGKVIRPGMEFGYTAELDASKIGFALNLITNVKVRFVATQSR